MYMFIKSYTLNIYNFCEVYQSIHKVGERGRIYSQQYTKAPIKIKCLLEVVDVRHQIRSKIYLSQYSFRNKNLNA